MGRTVYIVIAFHALGWTLRGKWRRRGAGFGVAAAWLAEPQTLKPASQTYEGTGNSRHFLEVANSSKNGTQYLVSYALPWRGEWHRGGGPGDGYEDKRILRYF